MTTYEKELALIVEQRYGSMDAARLVEQLCSMGVIDFSRCKILAVRQYVDRLTDKGRGKVDAMWEAAERFACSYEYVRKCVYYYTDVNVE